MSQAAGLEVGDTLQQVDGVHLGSYMDGMEVLDKQFGPVVLTARRKKGTYARVQYHRERQREKRYS